MVVAAVRQHTQLGRQVHRLAILAEQIAEQTLTPDQALEVALAVAKLRPREIHGAKLFTPFRADLEMLLIAAAEFDSISSEDARPEDRARVEEIRARLDAATPGPVEGCICYCHGTHPTSDICDHCSSSPRKEAIYRHAPDTIRFLLGEIKHLEASRERAVEFVLWVAPDVRDTTLAQTGGE